MTQDFIFAQDVILDLDTRKSVAVVRESPRSELAGGSRDDPTIDDDEKDEP